MKQRNVASNSNFDSTEKAHMIFDRGGEDACNVLHTETKASGICSSGGIDD